MSDKENISTEDKESTSTSSLSWYPIEDFVECMHEDPGVEDTQEMTKEQDTRLALIFPDQSSQSTVTAELLEGSGTRGISRKTDEIIVLHTEVVRVCEDLNTLLYLGTRREVDEKVAGVWSPEYPDLSFYLPVPKNWNGQHIHGLLLWMIAHDMMKPVLAKNIGALLVYPPYDSLSITLLLAAKAYECQVFAHCVESSMLYSLLGEVCPHVTLLSNLNWGSDLRQKTGDQGHCMCIKWTTGDINIALDQLPASGCLVQYGKPVACSQINTTAFRRNLTVVSVQPHQILRELLRSLNEDGEWIKSVPIDLPDGNILHRILPLGTSETLLSGICCLQANSFHGQITVTMLLAGIQSSEGWLPFLLMEALDEDLSNLLLLRALFLSQDDIQKNKKSCNADNHFEPQSHNDDQHAPHSGFKNFLQDSQSVEEDVFDCQDISVASSHHHIYDKQEELLAKTRSKAQSLQHSFQEKFNCNSQSTKYVTVQQDHMIRDRTCLTEICSVTGRECETFHSPAFGSKRCISSQHNLVRNTSTSCEVENWFYDKKSDGSQHHYKSTKPAILLGHQDFSAFHHFQANFYDEGKLTLLDENDRSTEKTACLPNKWVFCNQDIECPRKESSSAIDTCDYIDQTSTPYSQSPWCCDHIPSDNRDYSFSSVSQSTSTSSLDETGERIPFSCSCFERCLSDYEIQSLRYFQEQSSYFEIQSNASTVSDGSQHHYKSTKPAILLGYKDFSPFHHFQANFYDEGKLTLLDEDDRNTEKTACLPNKWVFCNQDIECPRKESSSAIDTCDYIDQTSTPYSQSPRCFDHIPSDNRDYSFSPVSQSTSTSSLDETGERIPFSIGCSCFERCLSDYEIQSHRYFQEQSSYFEIQSNASTVSWHHSLHQQSNFPETAEIINVSFQSEIVKEVRKDILNHQLMPWTFSSAKDASHTLPRMNPEIEFPLLPQQNPENEHFLLCQQYSEIETPSLLQLNPDTELFLFPHQSPEIESSLLPQQNTRIKYSLLFHQNPEISCPLLPQQNLETDYPLLVQQNLETDYPFLSQQNLETDYPLLSQQNLETDYPLLSQQNREIESPSLLQQYVEIECPLLLQRNFESKPSLWSQNNFEIVCPLCPQQHPKIECSKLPQENPEIECSMLSQENSYINCSMLPQENPENEYPFLLQKSLDEPSLLPQEIPDIESFILHQEIPENECSVLPQDIPEIESSMLPQDIPEIECSMMPQEIPEIECSMLPQEILEIESSMLPQGIPEIEFSLLPEQNLNMEHLLLQRPYSSILFRVTSVPDIYPTNEKSLQLITELDNVLLAHPKSLDLTDRFQSSLSVETSDEISESDSILKNPEITIASDLSATLPAKSISCNATEPGHSYNCAYGTKHQNYIPGQDGTESLELCFTLAAVQEVSTSENGRILKHHQKLIKTSLEQKDVTDSDISHIFINYQVKDHSFFGAQQLSTSSCQISGQVGSLQCKGHNSNPFGIPNDGVETKHELVPDGTYFSDPILPEIIQTWEESHLDLENATFNFSESVIGKEFEKYEESKQYIPVEELILLELTDVEVSSSLYCNGNNFQDGYQTITMMESKRMLELPPMFDFKDDACSFSQQEWGQCGDIAVSERSSIIQKHRERLTRESSVCTETEKTNEVSCGPWINKGNSTFKEQLHTYAPDNFQDHLEDSGPQRSEISIPGIQNQGYADDTISDNSEDSNSQISENKSKSFMQNQDDANDSIPAHSEDSSISTSSERELSQFNPEQLSLHFRRQPSLFMTPMETMEHDYQQQPPTLGYQILPHPQSVLKQLSPLSAEHVRARPLFMVHPITGSVDSLRLLATKLGVRCIGIQRTDDTPTTSVEDAARYYCEAVKHYDRYGPYRLLGYSFGGMLAFEMARHFQKEGRCVELLIMLDGSADFVKSQTEYICSQIPDNATEMERLIIKESQYLMHFVDLYTAVSQRDLMCLLLQKQKSVEERIILAVGMATGAVALRNDSTLSHASKESTTGDAKALENINVDLGKNVNLKLRLKAAEYMAAAFMADKFDANSKNKFAGDVHLIRTKKNPAYATPLTADYGLSTLCTGSATVQFVTGDHFTVLQEPHVNSVVATIKSLLHPNAKL